MKLTPLATLRRAAEGALALVTSAVTLVPSAAQTPGTVLLNISSAYVSDAQGNPFGEIDDGLVVFVVDLNGDGIAHPTMDSFAPGSDDFVIGSLGTTFDAGGTAILGGINLFANRPLYSQGPTVETGDAFAMFWYPELYHKDFLGVGLDGWEALMPGETAYGAYNTAESVQDSEWTIPNPPSAEDYVVFSTEVPGVFGTVTPSLLEARFVTVPEPSTALLSLLGAFFLFFRRRRHA